MNETIEELSKELNYYETALTSAKGDKDKAIAHEKYLSNNICIIKDKILRERDKQLSLLKAKEEQEEQDRKAHALEQIQSQTIAKMYIETDNNACGSKKSYVIETMEDDKYIIELIWTGYEDAEMVLDYYDKKGKV